MPAVKNENLRWLRHGEIDFARWNKVVESSPNCRVYACSWYLDLTAATWDALVWGDYQYVMPVPFRIKWGIRYIYQPFFTQQLGIYPPPPADIQQKFAASLKKSASLITYQADASLSAAEFKGFNISIRHNRSLLLQADYPTLSRGFSENTVRNRRKASQQGVVVAVGQDFLAYTENKRENTKTEVPVESFRVLERLLDHTTGNGPGKIYNAVAPDGKILAGAFFLFHQNRAYYLNAWSSGRGLTNGSAFAIMDRFIHDHAASGLLLDFEGSEIEGIDRFYRGFGAGEEPYYLITCSRIPSFLFSLKNKLDL